MKKLILFGIAFILLISSVFAVDINTVPTEDEIIAGSGYNQQYDIFGTGNINTTIWQNTGSSSEANGILTAVGARGSMFGTVEPFSTNEDFCFMYKVKMDTWTQQIEQLVTTMDYDTSGTADVCLAYRTDTNNLHTALYVHCSGSGWSPVGWDEGTKNHTFRFCWDQSINNGNFTIWENSLINDSHNDTTVQYNDLSFYALFTTGNDLDYFWFISWNGTPADAPYLITPPTPTTGVPTFVFPTPGDDTANNTNQTINMSCGDDTNMRYNLWFNENVTTLNEVLDNSTDRNWTMNVSIDDTYFYQGTCFNTSSGVLSANSSLRNFTLDTTTPTITINENNFFNTTNMSIANQYLNNATLNITFTDNDNVFAIKINITKGDVSYFGFANTSINELIHNLTRNLDISAWPSGIYDINITVADGHHYTGGYKIGDYKTSQFLNKITFDTTENNRIIISSDGAYTTTYTRETNSYSYGFKYLLSSTTRTFTIESEDGMIYYLPTSRYKAHFVVWNGQHGNWIDFEGIGGEYTVKKISDYKYTITFTSMLKGKEIITKSIGGLNVKTENYQWYRGTYNVSALETFTATTTDLTLNITRNSTFLNNITINLYYNNTVQTGITRTEYVDYIFFNKTVTAPTVTVNTNVPYFWNVTVNQSVGGYYNFTITENNSVLNWGIDNCTLFSTHAVNFTMQDEMNQSLVVSDITGTFNYSLDQITYRTYTLGMDDVTNLSMCITPENVSLYTDYTLSYSAAGYPQRRYFKDNDVLTNITVLTTLYLLHTDLGIYARFRVVNVYQDPISGVSGKMERTIGGETVVIELEKTDDAGLATFWVNPDEDYIFTFSREGYITESFTLRPTSSEIYTVTLEAEEVEDVLPYTAGITYFFSPSGVLSNNTNYTFTFNMTSSYWRITGCTFYIKNGSTILNQSSSIFNASNCDIAIPFNTGNYTTLTSETIYELNSTVNETVSREYTVRYTYEGEFSLKNFIDDITSFGMAGFNDFTRMIIAFVVIFTIIGLTSQKFGLRDPESLIVLTWALVMFFSYVGWLTLNYDPIPEIRGLSTGWLKQYIIFILFTLGAGFYIWRKHTE